MLASKSVLVTTIALGFPLFAFAQDATTPATDAAPAVAPATTVTTDPATAPEATPAATPAAEKAPEAKPAAEPAPAPDTDGKSRLERNLESGGGWLFPLARVGVSGSVGLPRLSVYSIDTRFLKLFGASISFGPKLETNVEDSTIGLSSWDMTARFFPSGGSFFLGLSYGGQTLYAKSSADVETTSANQTVKVPVEAKLEIGTTTFTPHLGWFATWDWGFSLGTEFGVQFPVDYSSDLSVETTSNDPIVKAAVKQAKQEDDYKKIEKDVDDLGKMIGKQILPYWNILRIGWMF